MKSEDLISGMSCIDEKYINEAETKSIAATSQNKWRQICAAAACLAVVAACAVGLPRAFDRLDGTQASKKPDSLAAAENSVFIPLIELPEKTDSGIAADMIALVVYNGKIYTQAETVPYDEKLLGDVLGTASGTIDEWSQQSEYAVELASNMTGDVYSVNGCDKDFRICVVMNNSDEPYIMYLENLNGIGLSRGEDLYGSERLKLKGNYESVVYQLHGDWDNAKGAYREFAGLSQEDIAEFVDALYNAPFEDLSNEADDIYSQNLKQAHIYFRLKDKTTVAIRLFENGYAGYENMHGRFFVKVDGDIFQKVFNASVE